MLLLPLSASLNLPINESSRFFIVTETLGTGQRILIITSPAGTNKSKATSVLGAFGWQNGCHPDNEIRIWYELYSCLCKLPLPFHELSHATQCQAVIFWSILPPLSVPASPSYRNDLHATFRILFRYVYLKHSFRLLVFASPLLLCFMF